MTLRIAYMTGEYPRASDTFIQREVSALRRQGVAVDTFSIRAPAVRSHVGTEQAQHAQRTFYVLPASPLALLTAHLTMVLRHPVQYLRAAQLAWRTRAPGLRSMMYQCFYFAEAGIVAEELRQRGITHLHNHFANSSCTVAMLAAAMGGTTFSFTLHGPAIFFEPKHWRLDDKLRRALFVSCISHYCRSQAMIWCPPDVWPRLHIVHCGVEPTRYQPRRHQADTKRLLFVGRLAAVKGLTVLLDAISGMVHSHPNLELTIVGDGPDRAQLQQQARELGLCQHVRFVGTQSQQQVAEHLQQADVFVMSSFAEGVPVVLMEAMAAGVPVVAPQIAGIPELVTHEQDGLLYPPGDTSAIQAAIERLLQDAPLRTQMGTHGRRRIEAEFHIDREAQRLRSILTAALHGQRASVRPGENDMPSLRRIIKTG